ncbi:MAG TPA: DUF2793 domain-containing protein [Pyrinomonadaceae bacterium]
MATELSSVDYLTRTVDRNRYFYGKLMTVRDFLREQEYFNSKRWLINRLLFGGGIVCGLDFSTVGGADVTTTLVDIQPGVALDPVGREVAVLERARVDLAKVVTEKFKQTLPAEGTADRDMLVCLNYNECPKEPVPSLGGSPCAETCESNRVGETYTVSLIPAPPVIEKPTSCEKWLNRQTVSRKSADYDVDRIAPVWVRPNEVFEVALKVTARNDVKDVKLSETVAGGVVIEPDPQTPTQFPTTPVSLRKGEFFIYVYQVQAPGTLGKVLLSGGAGVPTNPSEVEVINDDDAKAREADRHLGACPIDPEEKGVPVARITAHFNKQKLESVTLLDTLRQQRFRYNLSHVADLMDCVRESLRAESESPRPGHLFITFKDIEQKDLKPIGPVADHGKEWTVTRGDHVHALLLYTDSGLEFKDGKFRIEGNVGGERINFLKPISGQLPKEPQHLTTKGYVDSRIAGLDWQESVRDKDLAAPPPPAADPEKPYDDGARYLIPGNPGDPSRTLPKNPWNKNPGEIATWNQNSKEWEFTKPDEGTAVFVDDENRAYLFVEGKWIEFLATPEVAAGKGLRADGAVISVGQGPGLKVNENDVEVVYEPNFARPVGPKATVGTSNTAARGDHTHLLPLAPNGGLDFSRLSTVDESVKILPGDDDVSLRGGLRIEGLVGGENIDFLHPVWGQAPIEPRHLATKQYVDGVAAGLDWQNSVLDKDLLAPPAVPANGARYLVLNAGPIIQPPTDTFPPTSFSERLAAEGESIGPLPPPGPVPPPISEPIPVPDPDPSPRPLPDPEPLPLPTGPWDGHLNSIATWNGSEWIFKDPNEGMAVFVEDENTAYLFVDGAWTPFMAMPSVAAGAGLFAAGARLSVGQGPGLRVNENNVEVIYHNADPAPVGLIPLPGVSTALARGDHRHALPLAVSGGLEFVGATKESAGLLRVNGHINGEGIDFQFPVLGQDPLDPRHLTTKQYVDGLVSGLTWQSTVLDKDLTKPPDAPTKGNRYLLFDKPLTGTPWENHQGEIATWSGKKWDFTAPSEGMAAFVADENLAYLFADGKWMQFLAPPAPVGAGNGLIRFGTDLNVGQGPGVTVTPDAVSVSFGSNAPPPVGAAGQTGGSLQVAMSDHTHALPLAPGSGLQFVAGGTTGGGGAEESIRAGDETNGSGAQQLLRINGPVNGDAIDFQFPVFGQSPVLARHLATKAYVDSKGGGTVTAGDGLVNNQNGLSVGAGLGLVVTPDVVQVNFHNAQTQPVGQLSEPGIANTVARGDHTHAMPDVWGASVATGVIAFSMRLAGKVPHTISLPINPGLGLGAITVVVGLESEIQGEGTFVGDIDHFEDAMNDGSGSFRRFPSILLGATILPSGLGNLKNTTFEIWARASERIAFLPDSFRVRWWAYKPGKDLGVIDYAPLTPVFER